MLIFVQHSLSLACSSNIDQTPSRLPNKIAHPLEPSMIRRFNAPISPKLSLRRPGSFSFCVECIQHTIQHIQQVLNLLNCWNCVEYFVECLLKLNKQCIQQIQQSIQHCWICWISVEKCVECCWMDSTKTGGVRSRPRDIFGEIVALNLRFMDGFEGCAIFFRIRDGVWSMLPLHAREIFCWTEIQFCWISVEKIDQINLFQTGNARSGRTINEMQACMSTSLSSFISSMIGRCWTFVEFLLNLLNSTFSVFNKYFTINRVFQGQSGFGVI